MSAPNIVTAVVGYRAFDTMFETTVMFPNWNRVKIMILAGRQRQEVNCTAKEMYFGRRYKLGRSCIQDYPTRM